MSDTVAPYKRVWFVAGLPHEEGQRVFADNLQAAQDFYGDTRISGSNGNKAVLLDDGNWYLLYSEPILIISSTDELIRSRALEKLTEAERRVLGV